MASLPELIARLRMLAMAPVPTGALDNAVTTATTMTRRAAPGASFAVDRSPNGVKVTVAGPPVRTTQGYVHPAVVFRTAVERLLPEVAQRTALEIRESL